VFWQKLQREGDLMDLKDLPSEAIAGGVAGIPFLALVLKKIFTLFQREGVAASAAGAQGEIIDLLRAEVRRLGEINNDLANMVNELQRENMGLKKEISTLHDTINQMNEQLSKLSRRSTDPTFGINQSNRREDDRE
jgi:FtsZ-binding cell division protein ZapB